MSWTLWSSRPAAPGHEPVPLDQHIMPDGDLRPHEFSAQCWCGPAQHAECDNPHTYMHRSLDRREMHEGRGGVGLH